MDDEDPGAAQRRWQSETHDYRDRLLASAQASPGYAGAELKHNMKELILFAVGNPDDATAALIREAPSNIHVTWTEAPFTYTELTDEVLRIMHEQSSISLNSGGARHDGTGIHFTTTDKELLSADDPREVLGARYPVSVEFGERPTPL